MAAALESADRLLAVCTQAYFASAFGGAELRAAFVSQAKAEGRIVPVLIEPVTLPRLYAPLIPLDLTGLDEAAAAARLRERLAGGRPPGPPPFPREEAPSGDRPGFAGVLPAVWKVPPRNPRFTGRDGMLTELRRRLRTGEGTLVVQALYGLGGVGKTQLALEYAHRFAADYDLISRPGQQTAAAGGTDQRRGRRPTADAARSGSRHTGSRCHTLRGRGPCPLQHSPPAASQRREPKAAARRLRRCSGPMPPGRTAAALAPAVADDPSRTSS